MLYNAYMEHSSKYVGGINRGTVQREILISGVGLHSGEQATLRILPAERPEGLIFRATGSRLGDIPITPFHVTNTQQAVTLGNQNWQVQTVEHLMAALAGAGITDAYLEIDGPEVPICDGSAQPMYEAIVSAGVADLGIPVEPIRLNSALWVTDGDRYLIALPHDNLKVTCSIHYPHPLLHNQTISAEFETDTFIKDFLSARTFGFMQEVEALKARSLIKGASLDNAVVFTETGCVNTMRFPNECVRHKVLDLLGDLYLLNRPIQAHLIASKAGHGMDVELAKKIFKATTMDEMSARKKRRNARTPWAHSSIS